MSGEMDAATEAVREKGGCHSFATWALSRISILEAELEQARAHMMLSDGLGNICLVCRGGDDSCPLRKGDKP